MNITGKIKWFLGDTYAFLTFSESENSFSVDHILVPPAYRHQGIGTQLLHHILILADSLDKEVYLSARPFGTYGEDRLDQLVAYYQRFEFKPTDRGLTVVYMKREKMSKKERSQGRTSSAVRS